MGRTRKANRREERKILHSIRIIYSKAVSGWVDGWMDG